MSTRNPPRKPKAKPRGGRPGKAAAVVVVAAVEPTPQFGVDPVHVDPLRILWSIANDGEAPAQARVSACKALLIAGVAGPASAKSDTPEDALNRRTMELMKRGRPN